MVTEDQARVVKNKVKRQYWERKPWANYIHGVGLATLGTKLRPCPKDIENDPCVLVSIHKGKRLPQHLVLPREIDGVCIIVQESSKQEFQSEE